MRVSSEFYDQVGLAREIVERGLKMGAANLWVAGQQKGRAVFGDMGQGISPFPCALIFPQDEHERLLIDHLRTLGVQVERPVKLVGFEGGIGARWRACGDGTGVAAAFIAGCDGTHSTVRETR